MRVLIIGGTRFIGPYVVRRLVEEGHDVTLFHRGETVADLPGGVGYIRGDRKRLAEHRHEFERLSPDVLLDMIPFFEQDARDLSSVFQGIAPRLVAVSSSDVYRAYELARGEYAAPPIPVPMDEDAPLRRNLYPYRAQAKSTEEKNYNYEKILVERILTSEPELPVTVLRLPATYGPCDYQHRLFSYLKRMDDNRPAILLEAGLDRWTWTRGYVENVADAVALAVVSERASGRIYNVGEPDALSELEWARSIAREAGWTGEFLVLPKEKLPEQMRSDILPEHHLATDTGRIRRELDYAERINRPEALRRTIAWERSHPPEQIDPKDFDYDAEDRVMQSEG